MIIYRYEKEDGGGPWFYRTGEVRYPLPHEHLYKETNEWVFGCRSTKELFKYFLNQKVDLNNCTIKVYDIPKEEIIELNGQVMFPKHYIEIGE